MIRTEKFHEEHDVELTPEEQNIRGRQAARLALALTKHDALVETLAEEWRTKKKTMAGERETLENTLNSVSTAAETGKERRQVECEEHLVGVMVITTRCDTGETVGSRAAIKQELNGSDAPKAKEEPFVPSELGAKLRHHLALICAKLRPETAVVKALAKAAPEATEDEIKRAIVDAIELGDLTEESGGKLMWIAASSPVNDGAVPDDYAPAPH